MSDVVNIGEMFDYAKEIKMSSIKYRQIVGEVRTRLSRIVSEGYVQDAVSSLIVAQHVPILMALENAYWQQETKAQELVHEFMIYMSETNEEAVFDYPVIKGIESQLFIENDALLDLNEEIRLIYRSIEDDMEAPLEMPNNLYYETHHTNARRVVRETLTGIENFTFDFSEVEDLLGKIRYFISRMRDAQDQLPWVAGSQRLAIMDGAQFDFSEFIAKVRSDNSRFTEGEEEHLDGVAASLRGLMPEEVICYLPESATLSEWEVLTQIVEGYHHSIERNVSKFVQSLIDVSPHGVESDLVDDFNLPFSVVKAKWWAYDLQFYDETGW